MHIYISRLKNVHSHQFLRLNMQRNTNAPVSSSKSVTFRIKYKHPMQHVAKTTRQKNRETEFQKKVNQALKKTSLSGHFTFQTYRSWMNNNIYNTVVLQYLVVLCEVVSSGNADMTSQTLNMLLTHTPANIERETRHVLSRVMGGSRAKT